MNGRRTYPAEGEPKPWNTMSKKTRTKKQPAVGHIADRHDVIRVHGSRVNNLADVGVEIPKRRLVAASGG